MIIYIYICREREIDTDGYRYRYRYKALKDLKFEDSYIGTLGSKKILHKGTWILGYGIGFRHKRFGLSRLLGVVWCLSDNYADVAGTLSRPGVFWYKLG